VKTVLLLIGFVVVMTQVAEAQQSAKVYRIGVLSVRSRSIESTRTERLGKVFVS
jgi:hypothetical protein